jgi:uncharacterized damage-inducible protein DinB
MKEILLQLSAYNVWANQLLINTMSALPEDKQKQEVASSFSSLHKTLIHMWDAESIWWQRVKLQERINIPSQQFSGSFAEAAGNLLHQNREWNGWVQAANDHQLVHVFQYQNLKGEQFKQPIFQMLIHLFNHGTYHRGQLITMLRQLGVEKLPQTDFIVWSRKK